MQEFGVGLKWITQQCAGFSGSVGDVLAEVSDAVMLSLDPATMRQMNVFNPLEEGTAMALPPKKQVRSTSVKMAEMTLMAADCDDGVLMYFGIWDAIGAF